jgi:flagellum-specific peptidoglycan hydrolase FlgJ
VSTDLQQRLAEVAGIAARLESTTGVPAQMLIGQWAIESKWGAKPVGRANVFGIKRDARHSDFCVVTTQEVFSVAQITQWNHRHPQRPARVVGNLPDGKHVVELEDEFADYLSLEDSCRDYVWLIKHGDRYQKAWASYQATRDLSALIDGVARVYATAPAYATLLHQIAEQANVVATIQAAREQHIA